MTMSETCNEQKYGRKRTVEVPYEVAAASASRAGGNNEDSYLISELKPAMAVHAASTGLEVSAMGPQAALLMIVADGLGGLPRGDLASRIAVEEAACFTLDNVVHGKVNLHGIAPDSARMTVPGLRGQLAEAIQASDARVREEATSSSSLGSTITLGYLIWPILYTAHVGDTRAYVVRGNQLVQLTQDHTAQEPYGWGGTDQHADYWHTVMWNTLGDPEALARPELAKYILQPHDRWLLCSDGLYGVLTEQEIVAITQSTQLASDIAQALVRAALAAGSTDDITVIFGRHRQSEREPLSHD